MKRPIATAQARLLRVLLVRLLPVVLALALCAAALVAVRTGATAGGPARLPDLDQALPAKLVITRSGSVYRLGFRSAVSNLGDGPLIVAGRRASLDEAAMTADQLVERDGAPREVVRDVGRLRFVVSPDHRHWHLLGFQRYQLRRAGHDVAAVRDRKTGFCLGDRYPVGGRAPSVAPDEPVYTSRCGLAATELLGIEEGVSVGYGDDYAANLEGQYLPLTGLRAGRYVLVHRVNVHRQLRELDYRDNAASLLLELRWRRGQPQVRVLRRCPDSDRCDVVQPARRSRFAID